MSDIGMPLSTRRLLHSISISGPDMMNMTERKLKALGFEPFDRKMIMRAIERKMQDDFHPWLIFHVRDNFVRVQANASSRYKGLSFVWSTKKNSIVTWTHRMPSHNQTFVRVHTMHNHTTTRFYSFDIFRTLSLHVLCTYRIRNTFFSIARTRLWIQSWKHCTCFEL